MANPPVSTPHAPPSTIDPDSAEPVRDVPAWLAVWLPALVYPILLLAIPLYPPFYGFMQRKEGAIEYLGVGVLVVGVAIGLGIFKYTDRLPSGGGWLRWFYAISLLGMFVFAGEEISWGQHLGPVGPRGRARVHRGTQ